MNGEFHDQKDHRRPLQFRLRALFGAAIGCAAVFGLLRWFGVSPWTGVVILVVLTVSVVAAVGLLLAIIASVGQDGNGEA